MFIANGLWKQNKKFIPPLPEGIFYNYSNGLLKTTVCSDILKLGFSR